MMSDVLKPKRWYIYTVNLEPRVGIKPGKQRPCLAIQANEFVEFGLQSTVVLPHSTKITLDDAFPLRVHLPKGVASLKKPSEILIDQIFAWDNNLFHDELGILPEHIIEKVKSALIDFLDL